MARVMICGAFGLHNLGDDAILEAMIDTWKMHLFLPSVVAISYDPSYTRSRGIAAISSYDFVHFGREMINSDVLVLGGGGILHELGSPRHLFALYLRVLLARILRKKVMLYSVGVGPFRSRLGRQLACAIARLAHAISVRDADSLESLRQLGYRGDCVIAADPVFLLDVAPADMCDAEEVLDKLWPKDCGGPMIGFAPRFWYHHTHIWPDAHRRQERLNRDLAEVADWLVDNWGARVLLMPMQYPQDVVVCREIAKRLRNKKNIVVLEKELLPKQMAALIGYFSMVIAMRLHALILAERFKVPWIGLSYDKKVSSLAKRFDDRICVDLDLPLIESVSLYKSVIDGWLVGKQVIDNTALVKAQTEALISLGLLRRLVEM